MSLTRSLEYTNAVRPALVARPVPYRASFVDLCRAAAIVGALTTGLVLVQSVADAATIQPIEGSFAGGEGNSRTDGFANPFNSGSFQMISQQIWDASLFGSEPLTITGVNLRLDEASAGFTGTLSAVEIYMATAAVPVANATNRFSSNRGSDFTQTFAGDVAIDATGGGSPNPFDFSLPYSSAFTYDPNDGDLLLEFRVGGGDSALQPLDWQEAPVSDPIEVANIGILFFGATPADTLNGSLAQREGFVLQFVTSDSGGGTGGPGGSIPSVPLPGTLPLALMGIGGLGILTLRKRRETVAG